MQIALSSMRPCWSRIFNRQLLQVMRLTTILIFAVSVNVSAKSIAQSVTLTVKDAPLQKVFTEIIRQTGVSIVYDEAALSAAKPVSIDVKNMSVEEVMKLCMKDQPFQFSMGNNAIVVKALPEHAYDVIRSASPSIDISGRIENTAGQPLAGASVIVKRTGKGDIADANGKFSLKNVNEDDVITLSYTGYKTQSVKVGERTNFTIVLDVAVDELDRMVIQAYGKTSRRLATGNIEKVTAEEIERQPVMNPLLALQGKVAGLDVKQINGYASATVKVELRGRPNINPLFTSDPLYIIDGVPLTVLEIQTNSTNLYQTGSSGFIQSGNNGPAGGQSPLFSLNPDDIESIEVLKDADATAIYGSRGSNGVILISTKKGKAGKTEFGLNVNQGVTKVTRYYDLMNTQQYLQMRREALRNDGITPSLQHGDYDLLQWDTTRYTDWQKALYGGMGKFTNVQGSLSGGNAQTNFRVGFGYDRSTSIAVVSGADQRASAAVSLSHATANQKLSFGLSANYSFTQSDMVSLSGDALKLPPNAPAIYDSAGNFNWDAWGAPNSEARGRFYFSNLKQPYTSKTNFLNTSFNINFRPFKGLEVGTNFGYNAAQANQESFNPIAAADPLGEGITGRSYYSYNSNKNWVIEPQITYSSFLSRGKLDLLLGGSAQQTNTSTASITGSGFTNDLLIKSIALAPTRDASGNGAEYKYAAVFGRLTYNWQNKYLLNLSARRDGSSRFGAGKQFGNFGSIGLGWIFTDERFFKRTGLSFISFGKLRGSYGLTGSDGIKDYGYLTRLSSLDGSFSYGGGTILQPIQHANPDFHWATNKKLEAGIDLGFFNSKINIGVAYYRNRCGDQLLSFPVPILTGFDNVIANSPALVQNDGWEFIVSSKIIDGKNFHWGINFNTAMNHNKLVSYPNFDQSPYTQTLVIGKPLNMVKLLHYTGVDPLSGQYTFEDKDHDGQISSFGSFKQLGDTYIQSLNPTFTGGLGMDFSYKTVQLNLFFNIRKQVGVNALSQLPNPVGQLGNQPASLMGNQWQNPGDGATISKFSTLTSNGSYLFTYSDGVYTDASFIRLSNASLSYGLPARWIKKTGLQGCHVYMNMNNIFIITKYKGPDPETQNYGGLPPSRTVVAGLTLNF